MANCPSITIFAVLIFLVAFGYIDLFGILNFFTTNIKFLIGLFFDVVMWVINTFIWGFNIFWRLLYYFWTIFALILNSFYIYFAPNSLVRYGH